MIHALRRYATYELSHLLGVDPQAYWTENVPQPQQHVNITAPPSPTPAGTAMLTRVGGGQLSPTFEYRGFFVNDEDMLSGFAADPLGEAVFSVAMWDRVYVKRTRTHAPARMHTLARTHADGNTHTH